MNRVEFLAELEQRLSGIPEEERQAAIQYYADYLADAGEENEAEAIRELGSPEKVAESIKADYYGTEFDESRFNHKDYMEKYGQRSNQEGGPDNRSGAAPGSDGQGNGQSQKSAPWTSRGLKILLIILIAIVVWPVTLGVAGVCARGGGSGILFLCRTRYCSHSDYDFGSCCSCNRDCADRHTAGRHDCYRCGNITFCIGLDRNSRDCKTLYHCISGHDQRVCQFVQTSVLWKGGVNKNEKRVEDFLDHMRSPGCCWNFSDNCGHSAGRACYAERRTG